MENCCESLVKYFMIFWNILFFFAGCILIGFGIWSQVGAKDYLNFLGDNYVNTPIFLIIVGGIIFVIAFFGCCGAWMEKRWMINTYAVFLGIILVAQIGAGIAAYMLKGDLNTEVVNNMNKGMMNYGKEGSDGVTHTWDLVQSKLHCCGVEGMDDWHVNRNDTYGKGETPDSCCVNENSEIVQGCGTKKTTVEPGVTTELPQVLKYKEGCYEKFKAEFIDNIAVIGGVALGVAGLEFLVVLIACCLGRRMGGLGGQYV